MSGQQGMPAPGWNWVFNEKMLDDALARLADDMIRGGAEPPRAIASADRLKRFLLSDAAKGLRWKAKAGT